MNFFDDRLRTSVDYYREHRKDILLIDGTAPGCWASPCLTPTWEKWRAGDGNCP